MKRFIWIIPVIFLLLSACITPTFPQISDVQMAGESLVTVTWHTDIPTTAAVMLCDTDVGACQWFETEDCSQDHWFTVQLDPTRHYKITLVADHCGHQTIYEIIINPRKVKDV